MSSIKFLNQATSQPKQSRTVKINGTEFPIEERVISFEVNGEEAQEKYPFLVIDRPEKWVPASELQKEFHLSSGDNQIIKFKLYGISFNDENEALEKVKFNNKELSEEDLIEMSDKERAEYISELNDHIAMRDAYFIEKSTRMNIPGDSYKEKATSLQRYTQAQIRSLCDYIRSHMTGSMSGDLYMNYVRDSVNESSKKVIEFTGFDSIEEPSSQSYWLRFQRSTDSYITEIVMRGISSLQNRKIEEETALPEAPMLPTKLPNGGFDHNRRSPNRNDINWILTCNSLLKKRRVMIYEACLPFQIPGSTIDEKLAWIGNRPSADIATVDGFIENNMMSYKNQYDLFTNGFSL